MESFKMNFIEKNFPEIKNNGVVVFQYCPEPDFDRLHVKVWSATKETYICFLDAQFKDTISKVKEKVAEHPDIKPTATFNAMKIFFNGTELLDTDTLGGVMDIDDDSILHAVDTFTDAAFPDWVRRGSTVLNQHRHLLPHFLKRPPNQVSVDPAGIRGAEASLNTTI